MTAREHSSMTRSTEAEVLDALRTVSPQSVRRKGAERGLRLREDMGVGSLALVSVSVDLCDRFGVDPATLDLGSFIDRAETVGDLIDIVDELRTAQSA